MEEGDANLDNYVMNIIIEKKVMTMISLPRCILKSNSAQFKESRNKVKTIF